MSTTGFVCPQCTGHLTQKPGGGSVHVVMSTASLVAAEFDKDSFELQLHEPGAPVKAVSLPCPASKDVLGRTEFSWTLGDTSMPEHAVLTVIHEGGTRFTLELELVPTPSMQGVA